MPDRFRSPWSLQSLLEANLKEQTLSLSWEFRLELGERISKILSDLHRKQRAYGYGALQGENVLIKATDRFGLRGLDNYPPLEDESDFPDEENTEVALSKLDMLCLGVLLMELVTQRPLEGKELPQLVKMLRRKGLGNLKVIIEDMRKKKKSSNRRLKRIADVKEKDIEKSGDVSVKAQKEFVERELVKETMMRNNFDPEEAANKELTPLEKTRNGSVASSKRSQALIAAKNSARKAQRVMGKYLRIAREKMSQLAKKMNERRKEVKFPRWANFNNKQYNPEDDKQNNDRVSRNLLREQAIKEQKVDDVMASTRKANKKNKKNATEQQGIAKVDEYVFSQIIKDEVRKYLRQDEGDENVDALQKPSWLISLHSLIVQLLDSVDESRPTSNAARNIMIEILQSFKKSKERHEKVKTTVESVEFNSMNTMQKQTKLGTNELSKTMKKGDYVEKISLYEAFYRISAVEIVLDDLKEENGEVLVYHSKDISLPKDAVVDDEDGYDSDDSVMPPPKDYVPMAEPKGRKSETFSMEGSELLKVSVHNTGSVKRRPRDIKSQYIGSPSPSMKFPSARMDSVVTEMQFETELPPIIGPKADAILDIMDQERRRIGNIPKPKQMGKLFDEQKKLKHEEVISLLKRARELFDKESNIVSIDAPAVVVGDIHGQYFDIRQVMKFCGKPRPSSNANRQSRANSNQSQSGRAKSNRSRGVMKRFLSQRSKLSRRTKNENDKLVFNAEEFVAEMEQHRKKAQVETMRETRKPLPSFKRTSVMKQQNKPATKTLTLGHKLNEFNSEAEDHVFVDEKEEKNGGMQELPVNSAADEQPEQPAKERESVRQGGDKDKGQQYVFLGDYIDRGSWSCEVLFFLLSYKVHYPDSVIMLRGNHECETMADTYGFRQECEHKYGREVYHRCVQVFSCLPIACLINLPNGKRFLACHGGISDEVQTLKQIATLERRREPGIEGVLCDLLWSDPVPDDVCLMYNLPIQFESIEFIPNETRGCAKKFGVKALEKFLKENNLIGMIRAHEAKEEGFQFHFQNVGTKGHICVTVFSAPNYMGEHGNKGAVMIIHPSVKDRLIHQMKRFKYKYSVEQVLRQQDKMKDDYLDIIEPICYNEVPKPEVVVFENQNLSLVQQIEDACPYMPTIIDEFYNSALDILEKYGDAQQQLETYRNDQQEKAKEVRAELEATKAEKRLQKKRKGVRYWDSMKIRGSIKDLKATMRSKSRMSSREANHERFERTMRRVSEQHPSVMEEKLRVASARLERMETDALKGSLSENDADVKSLKHADKIAPENLASMRRSRSSTHRAHTASTRTQVQVLGRSGKSVTSASEADEDNKAVVEQIKTRGKMKRERVEVEHKEEWLELLSSWFSAVGKEDITPEDLCPALVDCVLLCQAASIVSDNPYLTFYRPSLNKELDPVKTRRNLIVFQDVCKELGISYYFLVFDIVNVELNFVLPCLIELAKIAKKKGKLKLSYPVDFPEELYEQKVSKEIEKEELRDRGLEVGNVSFTSDERLMLQLLFHMIDLEDTGLITAEAVIAWAREEGKLIKADHAIQVVSAIDYDNDGAIGLRDFFQYAARQKEEYLQEEFDFEDDEEGDFVGNGEDGGTADGPKLFFDQGGDTNNNEGNGEEINFDPNQAMDLTQANQQVNDDDSFE